MTPQDAFKRTGNFIRNSASLKMFSIGFLVLLLLIPASMSESLVREREIRKESVVREINQKWGYSQFVRGPFLTVPYLVYHEDVNANIKTSTQYLFIMPEELNISGDVNPQVRYRSIYQAVLYTGVLKISGNFVLPELNQLNIEPEDILWKQAMFSVGISDMRGIQDNVTIDFDEKKYEVESGLLTNNIAESGVKSSIPIRIGAEQYEFEFELNLNGSEELSFAPLGATTKVKLNSTWPSPSFSGAFLPGKREIGVDGFSAEWKVLHLNRNFPQYWKGAAHQVSGSQFGVKLFVTADIYSKSNRISKYAIIFIVFTFSAFFFSEILTRKRVHPIQYILIGLAITLFYVLLLSLSEHINFNLAYLLSAGAITLIITGYARGILKSTRFTVAVGGILLLLYGYLFIVLQLEDYSLLMGSIGLLAVLSIVMYITRSIDWYGLGEGPEQNDAHAEPSR